MSVVFEKKGKSRILHFSQNFVWDHILLNMPKVRPNGGIIRVKKDRNPIKPILSNPALNDDQVCNERRYTVLKKYVLNMQN